MLIYGTISAIFTAKNVPCWVGVWKPWEAMEISVHIWGEYCEIGEWVAR